MNNSQSSEVFSNSEDCSFGSSLSTIPMETSASYDTLIANVKKVLSNISQEEIQDTTFALQFTSALEKSASCITQSVDLINGLLADAEFELANLCEYIENAISLLPLLSGYIKNVVESISMSCCEMKTFPTTTGRILMTVFSHCKESETIYGRHLKSVEKQLKDLFRTCHELQITYLMVLEKHFIFDLTDKDQLDILIEALDINLRIGDIVQSLDVKTMAEQWKAFTMICEKHASNLMDKNIYCMCTNILCAMIENNVRTALEPNQEGKAVTRSLKVANFAIKILIKIYNIFRHATGKNHEHMVDLLLYLHLNNYAYLEIIGRTPQFIELVNNNVTNPTDSLLQELLLDEQFGNCVLKYNIEALKNDDKLLGYIELVIAMVNAVLQKLDHYKVPKETLIECVYRFLPYGHIWFNMGLRYKQDLPSKTLGLYEIVLCHTIALASVLKPDEKKILEQKMYVALLSTECYSALFSSNVWMYLMRLRTPLYNYNQLAILCKTYKKLETHKQFADSPQKIYLSYTIERLFMETYEDRYKMKLIRLYPADDASNAGLWGVLGIGHLDDHTGVQESAEEHFDRKLMHMLHKLFKSGVTGSKDINVLITTLKAASCSEEGYLSMVSKIWYRICPNDKFILPKGNLGEGTSWYIRFIEALISTTYTSCLGDVELMKILHVVNNMVEKGNIELNLLLINMICNTACENSKEHLTAPIFVRIFKYLLLKTEDLVKNKLYLKLKIYKDNDNIQYIMSKVVSEENSLQQIWNNLNNTGILKESITDWKPQLLSTVDHNFSHKCIISTHY